MIDQWERPHRPITMTSLYINKQGDADAPNNMLNARASPTTHKPTINRSQSDMKGRATAGLGPTKMLSVPIKIPRDRAMADPSPRFDRSAKTAQNDPSAGNLIFQSLFLFDTHRSIYGIYHRPKSGSTDWDNIRYNTHFSKYQSPPDFICRDLCQSSQLQR